MEEDHDATVQAIIAALPDKPQNARRQRGRAQKAFADLIQLLRAFEEFDADDDGFLNRVQCMRILPDRLRAKVGGTIADQFDAIDADRDGRIRTHMVEILCWHYIVFDEDGHTND